MNASRGPAVAAGRRALRLAVARYRRWLVAGCVAAAVAAVVHAVTPASPPLLQVAVAARDLDAGRVLGADDVVRSGWIAGSAPAGLLTAPAGRVLAGPVRRGEPITDARVLGPGLLAGQPPDRVAVTVRPAEAAAAVTVRAGERVDVLAGPETGVPAGSGAGETLAYAAVVLSATAAATAGPGGLLGPGGGAAGGPGGAETGGVLVLAVDRLAASRLAAAVTRPLSVAVHSSG